MIALSKNTGGLFHHCVSGGTQENQSLSGFRQNEQETYELTYVSQDPKQLPIPPVCLLSATPLPGITGPEVEIAYV